MDFPPCPACGYPAPTVRVHSHTQCTHCGTVLESCCMGAGDEDCPVLEHATALHPAHLEALFRPGGKAVTLTATSAVHRLHEILGCDLDTARGALEGAVAAGRIRRTAAGHLQLALAD